MQKQPSNKLICREHTSQLPVVISVSVLSCNSERVSSFLNYLKSTGNYSATSNNNYEVGTLAVDGWAVTFGTARRGLGRAPAHPGPSLLYKCNTHSSTASVPITVLPYNDPLLCGFNVAINGQQMTQLLRT